MKETYNWKSLFAGLIIILAGISMCIGSAYVLEPWNNILLSIGCSLIASGLVILMHDFFVERKQTSLLDEWNIDRIYSTRAEKSAESDPELAKAKYCLDAIGFGFSSFRGKHTNKVVTLLRKGVDIRIITMNPNSQFTEIRDKEEHKSIGSTSHSIRDMIEWADKLNAQNPKGKIVIKGYDTMTLDFYWRVDDTLYVGPYWYGVDSQQTITYRFSDGGKGFAQYTEYFDNLWDNTDFCKPLTKISEVRKKNRR